jgi:hypothetical protein
MTFSKLPDFAPACLALAALVAAGAAAASSPPAVTIDIQDTQTLVTLFADPAEGVAAARSSLVALPPDAERATAVLVDGRAETVDLPGGVMRLRGQPVVCVVVTGGDGGPVTVAVRHDGSWGPSGPARLISRDMHAGLPGVPDGAKAESAPGGGSYVIVTAPALAAAIQPLVDWKQQKGWPVVVVTTDETGPSNTQIKAWLQNAYDTWNRPPEYVLLVGDTDEIPAFIAIANYTDQPYVQLDGDDWLVDAMIGRLPVSTPTEASIVAGKIVAYESEPYRGGDGTDDAWFTRSVIIAGNESSSTPTHTVRWCQSQLELLGFTPTVTLQTEFLQPPLPPNGAIAQWLNPSLVTGASLIVYRGWAYGNRGWATPRYLDTDIAGLHNGQKLPVVLSFVCESGNYGGTTDCFGEVFLNQGSLAEPFKGAVAFVGNTEGHSHTRQNDAMAISFFEEIQRPEISTLGAWMNASKLRFIDFFPTEMEIETHGELSVEFYHHIYNLLGDPELNFHKGPLAEMTATYATEIAVGANYLPVDVTAVGARVGVVQDGQLIGSGFTGSDGVARLVLSPAAAAGTLQLTVTCPGRLPVLTAIAVGAAAGGNLNIVSLVVDDDNTAPSSGDGNQLAGPGETLGLLPTLINTGAAASAASALAMTLRGPGSVVTGTSSVGAIGAGQQAAALAPFVVAVSPQAADGDTLLGLVQIGSGADVTQFHLEVRAPRLTFADAAGTLEPGLTSEILLQLHNAGSAATAGGTVTISLPGGVGATVIDATATFGPLAPGATAAALDPLAVRVDATTAVGAGLSFVVTVVTTEGAQQSPALDLLVGDVDVTAPVGPDAHGYYVFDSADNLYPGQQPHYTWTELDPAVAAGAPGTEITFPADNLGHVQLDLPFPFTYYGQTFTSVRVSDNGWISFDAADATFNFYNWPLPSLEGPGAIVAPFWDNLNPDFVPAGNDTTGMGSSGIFYHHNAAAGTYTVEWSRQRHFLNTIGGLQTFQVVLQNQDPGTTGRPDDDFLFLYKQVANNDYERMFASVGFESPDETDGLQLTYDNLYTPGVPPLGPGLAMRITTEAPVRVPIALASLEARIVGEEAQMSWQSADDRPITGWEIWRERGGERVKLTAAPLPASAHEFTAPAADPDDVYVLVARHPYAAHSVAGSVAATAGAGPLALGPMWPNPVQGEGTIAFAMPRAGTASLKIFDVRGRCVRTLVDGAVTAGANVALWDGRDNVGRVLPDGVYVYRLQTAGTTLTRKLLVVR